MATELRSRLAPDEPAAYHELFRVAAQESQQAEVLLQRRLLIRAYSLLQAVSVEARNDNMPDAVAEELMRDISLALDRRPTLI
jgi:hypothetical protein